MRGEDRQQVRMFSYVSPEHRVPQEHPLRVIWVLADAALQELSPRFADLYSRVGRPSIAPEKLLRALLLQILYTIRSERLLIEQLDYNLLFRWFVGLSMDDEVWDHSVFSKNRDRLLDGDIATGFLTKVVDLARSHHLVSDEHFTVDGTLIEAWASQKSFQKKEQPLSPPPDDPGNASVNFHGETRTNQTHQSNTDPEARLYRKGPGKEAKLAFMGHAITENRHGLVIATDFTEATGRAEREAAQAMLKTIQKKQRRRISLGADKGYDVREFIRQLRYLKVTPHIAQKKYGAIDERTTRHEGYMISQKKRKLIEELFGWLKTIGPLRKARYKGRARNGWLFTFASAVYDLIRIRNLIESPA